MFTALILACNSSFNECRSYTYPILFSEEVSCMSSIQDGIMYFENQGLFVKDYACHQWKEEV